MNLPLLTRSKLSVELCQYSQWRPVDTHALSDDEKQRVTTLHWLIERYLDGNSISQALRDAGMEHVQVLRALNRCVALGADGKPLGWVGLLRGVRIKPYVRVRRAIRLNESARGGFAGAMGLLLRNHPDVQRRLDKYLITRRKDGSVPESRVSPKSAHAYFLRLCEEAGVGRQEWPFCARRRGMGALRAYVADFYSRHYDQIVLHQFGEAAAAKRKTGTGTESRLGATYPYDIVEADEHTADFLGSIGYLTGKGMRWVPIGRVTLLLFVDRFSTAVLGYHVIFRRAARTRDFMTAAADTTRPHELRDLTAWGGAYLEGAGFPSNMDARLARCGCSLLLLDNALIHLAEEIRRLQRVFGCAVNYGLFRRFERRAIAERIFGKLAQAGFHRVPSTTGSGPQDTRRLDAEAKACTFRLSYAKVLDLIEMMIAAHNATPTSANHGLSPNEQIRQYLDDADIGFLPPILPPSHSLEPGLDTAVETATIAGNRKHGHRPHIKFEGERYTNRELADSWHLLGEKVTLHINEDDIRTLVAYHQGALLGTLTVMGRWAAYLHSREIRVQVNSMVEEGRVQLGKDADPVDAWLQALLKGVHGKDGRGRRRKVARSGSAVAEEMRKGTVHADDLVLEAEAVGADVPRRASDGGRAAAEEELVGFAALNGVGYER